MPYCDEEKNKEYNRLYYAKNKEKEKARRKAYYDANRQKQIDKMKEYNQKIKEERANTEKRRLYNREWYRKNKHKQDKEKRTTWRKHYRENNTEAVRAMRLKHYYKHRERLVLNKRIYNSKLSYGEYGEAHQALVKLEKLMKGNLQNGTQC